MTVLSTVHRCDTDRISIHFPNIIRADFFFLLIYIFELSELDHTIYMYIKKQILNVLLKGFVYTNILKSGVILKVTMFLTIEHFLVTLRICKYIVPCLRKFITIRFFLLPHRPIL